MRLRLRFEPSNAPSDETRFEVSFQMSSLTSFRLSLRGSFQMSFMASFAGRFPRPQDQLPDLGLSRASFPVSQVVHFIIEPAESRDRVAGLGGPCQTVRGSGVPNSDFWFLSSDFCSIGAVCLPICVVGLRGPCLEEWGSGVHGFWPEAICAIRAICGWSSPVRTSALSETMNLCNLRHLWMSSPHCGTSDETPTQRRGDTPCRLRNLWLLVPSSLVALSFVNSALWSLHSDFCFVGCPPLDLLTTRPLPSRA